MGGAAATVLWITLPVLRQALTADCPEDRRTDLLLDGGLPACMGQPISDVEVLDGAHPDDSSWNVYYEHNGREYSYYPSGGRDLLFTQVGMRLTRACVNDKTSGTADALGASAAARLGQGVVPIDSVVDGRLRRVWILPGGGRVFSNRDGFVCITVAG